MYTYHPNAAGNNESAMALVTLGGLALLCWLFFSVVVRWSCYGLYLLWQAVDFPLIHEYAAERINLLSATGNGAEGVGLSEWLDVMHFSAGVLFVLLVPLLAITGWALACHPAQGFRSRRALDVHTLPRVMATFAPSVIPVLGNHQRDGLMHDATPENAWALTPEAFAQQHGLIQSRELNRDTARAVFEAQTGPAMMPPAQWQAHERALLAVFGLQVFAADRKAATQLLDDLNRSCMTRRVLRLPVFRATPDWRVCDTLLARVLASPGVNEWLAQHGSVRTALVGLYGRNLHLPPARFRWLKGCDRTLWYALHTADTEKVFVEGAGVVAQARAECMAARLGLPRPPLMTAEAVDGLQRELDALGLIYPREAREKRAKPSHQLTFPEVLYQPDAPDDDLSDSAAVRG